MAAEKTTKTKTTKKTTKTKSASKKATKKTAVVKETPKSAKTVSKKKSNRSVKKVVTIFVLVFIAVLVFSSRSVFVVATVNGTPIYRWDVIERLEKVGGKQVVDEMIQNELIAQEAQKRGITISEEAVQEEIDAATQASEAQGTPLELALEQANLTMEDYKENVRIQQTVRAILEGEIAVTDEEIETTFVENESFFEGLSSEEAKAEIRKGLTDQKLQEKAATWLEELKQNSSIDNYREY